MPEGPWSRIMRERDRLVVVKKGDRAIFKIHDTQVGNPDDRETQVTPIIGVKVRFDSGPRMGMEGYFGLEWPTPTSSPISFFIFPNEKEAFDFSDLIDGEVLTVISIS